MNPVLEIGQFLIARYIWQLLTEGNKYRQMFTEPMASAANIRQYLLSLQQVIV